MESAVAEQPQVARRGQRSLFRQAPSSPARLPTQREWRGQHAGGTAGAVARARGCERARSGTSAGLAGVLHANAFFTGDVATAAATGSVVFSVSPGTFPAGVTTEDGRLTASAGAAPGRFSFDYEARDAADPGNCATATVQLAVPQPVIPGLGDTVTLDVGKSADLLASDTLAGAAAASAGERGTAWGGVGLASGLPGGTRTPDIRLRRSVLYPVELRADGLDSRSGATPQISGTTVRYASRRGSQATPPAVGPSGAALESTVRYALCAAPKLPTMLDAVRRWLSPTPTAAAAAGGHDAVAAWAKGCGLQFRGVREGDGFVIDGQADATAWRLEWGPSQRPYVPGNELRLRADLGLANDVQVLLLDRLLQERMEATVFNQYVEGVQTRIDTQTPPEMRWLVMFPKLAGADLGVLRERFVGISSHKTFVRQWLQGALGSALSAAPSGPEHLLMLMISRGRLVLRTALATPETTSLESWVRCFEAALREARRTSTQAFDDSAPSTQASVWAPSSVSADTAAAGKH